MCILGSISNSGFLYDMCILGSISNQWVSIWLFSWGPWHYLPSPVFSSQPWSPSPSQFKSFCSITSFYLFLLLRSISLPSRAPFYSPLWFSWPLWIFQMNTHTSEHSKLFHKWGKNMQCLLFWVIPLLLTFQYLIHLCIIWIVLNVLISCSNTTCPKYNFSHRTALATMSKINWP